MRRRIDISGVKNGSMKKNFQLEIRRLIALFFFLIKTW